MKSATRMRNILKMGRGVTNESLEKGHQDSQSEDAKDYVEKL